MDKGRRDGGWEESYPDIGYSHYGNDVPVQDSVRKRKPNRVVDSRVYQPRPRYPEFDTWGEVLRNIW